MIDVTFEQSLFNVNENAGLVQPVLILSNPSSTSVVIEISNTDGSALGELMHDINDNLLIKHYRRWH